MLALIFQPDEGAFCRKKQLFLDAQKTQCPSLSMFLHQIVLEIQLWCHFLWTFCANHATCLPYCPWGCSSAFNPWWLQWDEVWWLSCWYQHHDMCQQRLSHSCKIREPKTKQRNILSLQHPAGFETPDRVKYLNSSWKFLEAIMQMYAQRSCSGNNVSRNIPGVLHWTICPCAHRITWSIHAHYINSALTLISSIISHQISSLYTVIYY